MLRSAHYTKKKWIEKQPASVKLPTDPGITKVNGVQHRKITLGSNRMITSKLI